MEVPQAGRPRESENASKCGHWPETGVEQPTGTDGDWPDWRFKQEGIWNASNLVFYLIIKHSVSDGFV